MISEDALLPLAQSLADAKGWDDFTRTLMLSGKALAPLPLDARTETNAVEGCESPVWIAFSENETRVMAYSPSKVIRGVLAVLLEKANALTQQQRETFDYEQYLSRCQLERYLSQSRGNGIKSVIAKLKGL
ncbi:SufE family protein [Alteromonas marina]|uniref:SufE family protein n=1 Tax=unclassified Alteromonas TaxID=2614992 RepID=UPI0012E58552|nr:SufE family protein [Alteromonas sp. KUL150]GFD71174.1 cysteine desulfurase, sulfur acceptor subunit CsdE [Tenacibaculum sp. KUL113]GFD84083.1 cysteine desulfurase, sulfur acceptor subunit CsdE [Alteromonas sp. KUL150]|tara:strand:+ start:196 stop:588 length:393 start_codon:yes stop_codon:yes gene_type:complete